MDDRRRIAFGLALIVAIFLLIQLAALALVEPFKQAGYQAVDDPGNPTNTLLYVVAILAMTGLMLLAFRYDVEGLIRLLIVGSGVWIATYVLGTFVPPFVSYAGVNVPAVGLALLMGAALLVYPEWYVIDSAGVVMGAGAAGLFGITFGLLPALLLLAVLAVYDAISVYGTEHMLTLASGVMSMKVPVVLVIPLSPTYSFLDAEPGVSETEGKTADEQPPADGDGEIDADGVETAAGDEERDPDERETAAGESAAGDEAGPGGPLERDALFIGLGDTVIPTVLVASAAFFLRGAVPGVAGVPLPAATAMLGTFAGLSVLMWMVLKGRPHAGLPLLNGGTIAGYLLGALASGLTLAQALGLAAVA
ncbi:MAG: presenilin family intramembrane aspartyl protease PSH [Haloarculaceae archaeon]